MDVYDGFKPTVSLYKFTAFAKTLSPEFIPLVRLT